MNSASQPSNELIRVRSDYVGAGAYVVLPGDSAIAVNTTYGVQATGLDGKVKWQVDLGERCIGLAWQADGVLLANTLHATHQLDANGTLQNTTQTRHEIAHAPVPWGDGMLLATLTRLYALDSDGRVRWKYRLRDSLGESVRAVLILGVHVINDEVVVGAVDYNSGVGRVLVLDLEGEVRWQSDLGPITSFFPTGDDEFLYTLSGYGRFESVCCNSSGDVKWRLPVGGPGLRLDDESLAILVGNNESPTWDNWELRMFMKDGLEFSSRLAKGHCSHPPVEAADGSLYFTSFFKPLDPSESRLDYTSFVPQPVFQAFDYLMRVKAASHQYDVYYFRARPDEDVELLFEDTDSVAFGPTVAGENHVFFVHNKDHLVLPIG